MMRRLLGWLGALLGTGRQWVPSTLYLLQWPAVRHGKTGIAAARRQARKLRNQRRARRG
jgi:hypothetical protein